MNPINPFENNDFHCHSKFRPPEIEAVEFRARCVWPDWDDYPPYQSQNKEINNQSNKNNRNAVVSITNERTKKRYNMEIKKTQDEIEEMTKRFRLYDFNYYEPKNSVGIDSRSYEFFKTNQNKGRYSSNASNGNYYNTINDDYSNRISSTNDYHFTNKSTYNSINNNNFDIRSQRYDNYNNDSYYNAPQIDISNNSNSFSRNQSIYNQSFSRTEKNGDDVDYEITAAATLEAGFLREQNEAMRRRINYLKRKLEAQKNENRQVLKKIEVSEIDRHKMIDYLNSLKVKK